MTGPGKTGLIYTKYTCLYYGMYLLFCICYPKSISFIEFLMDFCIYDDILDTIWIANKKLLHFKLSKSGQILHLDKTYFPRPGHIYDLNIDLFMIPVYSECSIRVYRIVNTVHCILIKFMLKLLKNTVQILIHHASIVLA